MKRVAVVWVACWFTIAFGLLPSPCIAEGEQPQPPAQPSASGDQSDQAPEQEANTLRLGAITLKGLYPEEPQPVGLLGEQKENLRRMLDRIDRARGDAKIGGLVLRLDGAYFGWGQLHELRRRIQAFRQSGKKVYAVLTQAGNADYLIASGCDQIVMPPSGWLLLTGVRAEVIFFKGLLDWIGVEADMLQLGRYKGAAEPFTRFEMSPELREELTAIVDDHYDYLVSAVAERLEATPERAREVIDQGPFVPDRAVELRLIDHVAYVDQLQETLRKATGAESVTIERDYAKQKQETDFTGFSGMMKLFQGLLGGPPAPAAGPTGKSKIALLYATGVIVTGKSGMSFLGTNSLGAETFTGAIRKARQDSDVAALVIRVNSPGGSALASDMIWHEVARTDKPVVVSMGDLAASGGYYISMAADRILAEPGTLTGSIGVVGGKFALAGLYKKLGLSVEVISRGKNANLLASNEPFSPSEREAMQLLMRQVYEQFVTKAAKGRKMERTELERLAQGRVWTGRQAVANGLADRIGTLDDAIEEAKKLAGIDAKTKVELLILPKPKSILEHLLDPFDNTLSPLAGLPPDLAQSLREAGAVAALAREPVLTLMPFRLRIR